MSNLAGVYYNDTAAAPGISVSIYLSGCNFHCKGCHNPETWDFNYGEPYTADKMKEIVNKINDNGVQRNLCFLGGEPLNENNIEAVINTIKLAQEQFNWIKIYIWSGYTIEKLFEKALRDNRYDWILRHIDCLIDGLYIEEKKDLILPLRGSSNQRVHYFENN